jgi:hypothetical protein
MFVIAGLACGLYFFLYFQEKQDASHCHGRRETEAETSGLSARHV